MTCRALALGLLPLAVACATTPPLDAPTSAPIALMPRWAEPVASRAAPPDEPARAPLFVTSDPRQGTVRIAPPEERDPVDALVRAHQGRRRLRSLALRDAPVGEALRMFAELGAFNLVLGDDVGNRTVTLALHDVTLLAAFRAVLSAAHLGAEVVGGEVVEVRPRS